MVQFGTDECLVGGGDCVDVSSPFCGCNRFQYVDPLCAYGFEILDVRCPRKFMVKDEIQYLDLVGAF